MRSNSLFFTDQGKGKPIVFLHGFLETHTIWEPLTTQLSKNYRILCFDLPGFGKSSSLSNSNFSISDIAHEVLKNLKTQGITQPVVIGHSLGGYVSLALVEEEPSFIDALGLFHSTAYADTPEKKDMRTKTINFIEQNGTKMFCSNFIAPLFANPNHKAIPDLIKSAVETKKETILSYLKAMRERPDRTQIFKTFERPVLFLAGNKDSVIPYETIEKQSQFAKNPYLVLLEGVGHMAMFEDPNKAIEAIILFVEKTISR